MVAQRAKTLSYRRAEWFGQGATPDLEKCLRQPLAQLKTIEERTIVRGGRNAKVAKMDSVASGGLYLHLATETPGEPASLVPKVDATAIALDLKTENPPDDGEWLDGDAFLYMRENHVCLCTTGLHDSSVAAFLRYLFEKAKLPQHYRDFDLMKVADISRLNLLHKQGVREIEIRGALYKVTADYARRQAHVAGVLGATGKAIKTFLKKPHDVTEDSLQVILTIKTDRRSAHLSLGEKTIEELAEDIITNYEADDDYVIVTNTGQKIRPHEIFMRTTTSITADGKTVDRDDAWQSLLGFYDELRSSGALEE